MADAVNASAVPPGMDAYAGYVNGAWPSFAAIVAAHPGVPAVPITISAVNFGDCLDIESGDATASQAPGWWSGRVAAGVWRPILYTSQSNVVSVVQAMGSTDRGSYRIWSAHYDARYGAHICGPICGIPIQCDGTQWIDHGNWDESLLNDFFFGAPPSPAPTSVTGTDEMERLMALANSLRDAFSVQVRDWWARYRTDPFTSQVGDVMWYVYNLDPAHQGFGGSIDLVLSHIIDSGKTAGVLRPPYDNPAPV